MYTVTSDVDSATRDCVNFFRDQVPFALSQTVNDLAFAGRTEIITKTFPRDFTVRNPTFARTLWKVEKGTKADPVATIRQNLDRGDMERHIQGGTKTPRGSKLAVPLNPNEVRGARGAVRKAQKPANLPKKYIRRVNGKDVIFSRGKAMYVLLNSAAIAPRFGFYTDLENLVEQRWAGIFSDRLDRAIRSSRFFPG